MDPMELKPPRREGRPRHIRRLEARLAAIPEDGKCRVCGSIITVSRSWVIGRHPKGPVCRSCWFKFKEVNKP